MRLIILTRQTILKMLLVLCRHFSEHKIRSSDSTCSQLSVNSLKNPKIVFSIGGLMDMKTSIGSAEQSSCNLVNHPLSVRACVDGILMIHSLPLCAASHSVSWLEMMPLLTQKGVITGGM